MISLCQNVRGGVPRRRQTREGKGRMRHKKIYPICIVHPCFNQDAGELRVF